MTERRSCGARCARENGAHGTISAVWLEPHEKVGALGPVVAWKGFRVSARYCGDHCGEASHDIDNPERDARRFTVGALVGPKTVQDLCTKREKL